VTLRTFLLVIRGWLVLELGVGRKSRICRQQISSKQQQVLATTSAREERPAQVTGSSSYHASMAV
jgi:hypothetical protein